MTSSRLLPFRLMVSLGFASLALGQTAPQDNWTLDHTLQGGLSNGLFLSPSGVAVSPAGEIVVADSGNSRIQVFSATGSFIRRFGTKGTGNGQFGGTASPSAVAVMSSGMIVALDNVRDHSICRVELFQADGTFVRAFDVTIAGDSQSADVESIAITSDGQIAAMDNSNQRLKVFNLDGTFARYIGAHGSGDGQFIGGSVAATSDGKIIVGDFTNARIQVFANDGTFLSKFGSRGTGDGQFTYILSVAALPNGNIAVADNGTPRVEIFSSSGVFLGNFGSQGTGNAQFASATGLAVNVANQNQIVLLDATRSRVMVFASDGTFVTAFGTTGRAVDGFGGSCYSIAVTSDGTVFVNDSDNTRTQIFSVTGQFIGFVSTAYSPMVTGPNNTVLASTSSGRIDVLSNTGVLQFRIGGTTPGSGDGQLGNGTPEAVTDTNGDIYVTDGVNSRVEVFDSSGNFLRKFGSPGTAPGQLDNLAWIGLTPGGQVVVENFNNQYVLQYFTKQGTFVSRQNFPYTDLIRALGPDGVWYLSAYANAPSATTTILTPQIPGIATAVLSGGSASLDSRRGTVYSFDPTNKQVNVWRRGFRTLGAAPPRLVPMPSVAATNQRSGTGIIDIDYSVTDGDSSTATVAIAAFKNGSVALRDLIPVNAVNAVEGTGAHLGASQPTGQVLRVSWDAGAAGVTANSLVFEVFARDDRPGLLDFEFVTLPGSPALTISRIPVTNADLRAVWAWLLLQGDPNLSRDATTGEIDGPGGVAFTTTTNDFDSSSGTTVATTHTTIAGRAWVYAKLGVREATTAEATRARMATATSTPNQYALARSQQMGSRPHAVNEWTIDSASTYDSEARWVAPVSP